MWEIHSKIKYLYVCKGGWNVSLSIHIFVHLKCDFSKRSLPSVRMLLHNYTHTQRFVIHLKIGSHNGKRWEKTRTREMIEVNLETDRQFAAQYKTHITYEITRENWDLNRWWALRAWHSESKVGKTNTHDDFWYLWFQCIWILDNREALNSSFLSTIVKFIGNQNFWLQSLSFEEKALVVSIELRINTKFWNVWDIDEDFKFIIFFYLLEVQLSCNFNNIFHAIVTIHSMALFAITYLFDLEMWIENSYDNYNGYILSIASNRNLNQLHILFYSCKKTTLWFRNHWHKVVSRSGLK